MLGIPATELAGIPPGSVINGVSFRSSALSSPPPWPLADTTLSNCDLTVGYAAPLASWTGSFLANVATTPLAPVMVRTGPLLIETGTYVNLGLPAPQPTPWGDFFWDFQKTFPYIGGDLVYREHAG